MNIKDKVTVMCVTQNGDQVVTVGLGCLFSEQMSEWMNAFLWPFCRECPDIQHGDS